MQNNASVSRGCVLFVVSVCGMCELCVYVCMCVCALTVLLSVLENISNSEP